MNIRHAPERATLRDGIAKHRNAALPHALAALRIVSGFLFTQHGAAKLFHVPHLAMFDDLTLLSLLGLAGVLEFFGGLLLLAGLCTRATAFVLSGEMAVAYFMAHVPLGHPLSPMLNEGEPAVLYCFIYLLLSVAGAGAWSLDALRARQRTPHPWPAVHRP